MGAWKLRLNYLLLSVLQLLKTSDGTTHSRSGSSSELPASTSDLSLATSARPDASGLSSNGVLSAERASVGGMSRDLESLRDLSQRSTITGTILTCDTDLLGSLSHLRNYSTFYIGKKAINYQSNSTSRSQFLATAFFFGGLKVFRFRQSVYSCHQAPECQMPNDAANTK
jgi:hypothetical protein